MTDDPGRLLAMAEQLEQQASELRGIAARLYTAPAGLEAAIAAHPSSPEPAGKQLLKLELTELKDPKARRILRVGDVVNVKPSRPGKRDGWRGTIRKLTAGMDVEVTWPGGSARTVKLDRIGARVSTAAGLEAVR